MDHIEVECLAECPEPVTVPAKGTIRCSACGTRYRGAEVVSSPIPEIEQGDTARVIRESTEEHSASADGAGSADGSTRITVGDVTIEVDGAGNVGIDSE